MDTTDERVWRIYFGTRDEMNRNRIGYIEVEAGNPANVLYEHDAPVLDLGRLGTFDDCGVMPSWILNHDGKKYLYYIGWTVRTTIPYHNSIGLAISTDGGRSFERFSEGPLFGETYLEPFFTGTSCVLLKWDSGRIGICRVPGGRESKEKLSLATTSSTRNRRMELTGTARASSPWTTSRTRSGDRARFDP